MKEFKNKVAVITGAAHGIGKELAKEAAAREMKLVLADIDYKNLLELDKNLKEQGAEVLSLESDVTIYSEVENIAKETINKYGSVDLLFNNAGVGIPGPVWELPLNDIDYIMYSNVYSIVYGLKVFIPIMLKQDTPCHIVNTASIAGLMITPSMPTYHMTKHANVALTESVNLQLQKMNSKIKMSVYCPGFIQTELHKCDERRPERFKIDENNPYYSSQTYKVGLEKSSFVINTGIPIDSVSMSVFNAIEEEQFYILTHPQYNPVIGLRAKNILEGKNPDVSVFIK